MCTPAKCLILIGNRLFVYIAPVFKLIQIDNQILDYRNEAYRIKKEELECFLAEKQAGG